MPFASAFRSLTAEIDARWPEGRRRASSIGLALALELLLLLVLLTLGARTTVHQPKGETVSTFDVRDQSPKPEKRESGPAPAARAARPSPLTPPQTVPSPRPVRTPPPALVLPRPVTTPLPAAPASSPAPTTPKITAVIRSDMANVRGPQGSAGASGDSERIAGSGPNGEPLYRAEWYREPYRDELTGYLDYVKQDAWALINCQTEPEYRVDHCVLVDEWPQGSNMGRAILAAAWQFKVRPPRVGGKVLVGEWVRIKIDYTIRRK
jgi:protein TonB